MDINIVKVEPSQFIPIPVIENLVGEKLDIEQYSSDYIRRNSPAMFNLAIERSLTKYTPHIFPNLPRELLPYRTLSQFYLYANEYLRSISKEIAVAPKEQVCYTGRFKGILCFKVHLANALLDELFISDIFLQNPKETNYSDSVELSADYVGLGNGIFDLIISNIEQYALKYNYSTIGLVASTKISMNIFERRGYSIDNNQHGKRGEKLGMSYPMTKNINRNNN